MKIEVINFKSKDSATYEWLQGYKRHWKATELYKVLAIYIKLYSVYGLPRWLSGKDSTCNAGATGDAGLIPGLGRSPGGGHGNPLQYPCLENPVNKRA